MVGLCQNEG
ncbi:hypothetical protein V6N11_081031 [Hibiscus sabdariffa]|uniref:Uncharacterized protein n=1 Tax=Hibiscus sabdariffa TaxID=183260 RepID=A0ABR2QIN2_9ROSI